MNMIWLILPAMCGVIGLMLTFAGLGRLFKLQPFSGVFRLLFGVGFLGVSGGAALTGLNLQTYKRLTYERPVATLTFAATETPDRYSVSLVYPGGEEDTVDLAGDEWELNARVVKFKAFSNLLGFNSLYKLDRLYGRYEDVARASETNGLSLATNPGLDLVVADRQIGGRLGVIDARYGSAAYNPMRPGLSYIVCLDQSGLIARPNNAATAAVHGLEYDPGAGCVPAAAQTSGTPTEEP